MEMQSSTVQILYEKMVDVFQYEIKVYTGG